MQAKGFTLIELLTTVAVLAILVTLAVPSFRTMLMNNRLQATRTDLMSAFTFAKSEAVKRGIPVYVTALGPAAGNEFAGGWQVWVDSNANGSQEAGEPTIRQHEAYPPATTVAATPAVTAVGFNGRGFLIGPQVTLNICDGRSGVRGGQITLTSAGTIYLREDYLC
ncbi:GspH/FimT family pseudopilin [Thiobacter aerophilum]|uniref:Type II secretion system protein H n=1 Tax=Thiobacter aerophilum TaxID=3121275 RepID=A0ABV0EK87_9BURK